MTASIPIHYETDIFALEIAKETASKISGLPITDFKVTYSSALDGYVVSEDIKSWILKNKNQSSKGQLYNNCPASFFNEIDKKDSASIRIGNKQEGLGPEEHPAGRNFWETYPVYYGDGMYTQGEFFYINKTNLLTFMQQLTEKSLSLNQHYYYFNSRYFELVPVNLSSIKP